MLKVIEYLYVDLVIRTILLEQFAKSVCEIIALSKLEDRLLNLLSKPYDCLPDELRSPFARSHEPWSHISGKETSRIFVNIE